MKRNHLFFAALLMGCFVLIGLSKAVRADTRSDQPSFLHNLRLGSTGAEVERLQRYLNNNGAPIASSGPGSAGNETTYFGPATSRAVARFQELHASTILSPVGLTKGTGNFFTATRNFINQLLSQTPSAAVTALTPVPTTPVPASSVTYQLGGSITGLTAPVMIRDGAGNSVTIKPGDNARFVFPVRLQNGTAYQVSATMLASSNRLWCFVSPNGKGTIADADVMNVKIRCTSIPSQNPFEVLAAGGGMRAASIGGTISGLLGSVILLNNGEDANTITGNGPFTFANPVVEGSPYHVTVQTQPVGRTCTVSNGSGTMGGSTITDVSIDCVEESVAYVTPLSPDASNPSQIQQYLVSHDGLLSLSENATQTEGHYGQMTFATVNGTQYAYILENGVIYCSINSDGTLDNCARTTALASGMNYPRGIAFATVEGTQYAYLADPISASLFQCAINITNGDLSSCTEYLDGNIDAAFGIAFNTDGNGVQHAYVADAAMGMVVCPIDATGAFMSSPGCASTPSIGAPSWFPYSIAFTTVSGTRYAYVADNGTGADLGHVYRCLLNTDGTFQNSGCVATPTDTSSFAPWNPYAIAFKTLNGIQYAYVVNNQSVNIGSIYRCIVDDATGLLTHECIKIPDLPTDRDTWQPSGITFR